jgi:hypothetical protein
MPDTLVQIFSVTVPAGGSVVQAHTLNVNGIAVKPDEVGFDRLNTGLDVDPANVTTTTIQIDNPTGNPITANMKVLAWHTILRQFGLGQLSFGAGLTPQPFVTDGGAGGGGGGGGLGNPQSFEYVATGAEGSDFFVPLPAARANDAYLIQCAQGDVAFIIGYQFPNTVPGDRTTTQFRMVTTIAVTAGDTFMFIVNDPT